MEKAICAVASVLRKRSMPRPPGDCDACPLMIGARSTRVACIAGNKPNSSIVNSDAPAANTRAVGLSWMANSLVNSTGRMATMISSVIAATSKPTMPPMTVSTLASVKSCDTR